MRYLTIIALAAVAFSIGACAHKDETANTTSTSTGSSYRK